MSRSYSYFLFHTSYLKKMIKNFFLSEKNMLFAIVLNAVVIFLWYFPQFHGNSWLQLIDHFFILLFALEAVAKIREYGWKAYWKTWWNRFDFLIVLFSLPSLLENAAVLPDASWLLILRLFRLVRLIRFIHFVPHIEEIVNGLGRALKASVFVMILLFGLNFLLAIFTCHFYGEIAPEYFGNPMISSYSIFQMFTVEGWNEIPASIVADSDDSMYAGLTRFYFVLVVLFGGIFGMSLANAVFVDEMTMDNNDQLEKKVDELSAQVAELKEILEKL